MDLGAELGAHIYVSGVAAKALKSMRQRPREPKWNREATQLSLRILMDRLDYSAFAATQNT